MNGGQQCSNLIMHILVVYNAPFIQKEMHGIFINVLYRLGWLWFFLLEIGVEKDAWERKWVMDIYTPFQNVVEIQPGDLCVGMVYLPMPRL